MIEWSFPIGKRPYSYNFPRLSGEEKRTIIIFLQNHLPAVHAVIPTQWKVATTKQIPLEKDKRFLLLFCCKLYLYNYVAKISVKL
jgi:hypothetical protein